MTGTYEGIDEDGYYTDNAGGTYYAWILVPAKDYNSLPIQGTAKSTYTFTGALSDYLLDYAMYNTSYNHPVPSGYCYWQWNPSQNGIAASTLKQFIGNAPSQPPSTNPYIIELYRDTSTQNYVEVTGMSQNWYLVKKSQSGYIDVWCSEDYIQSQQDSLPLKIYFTDTIVGCYRVYAQNNEDKVTTIENTAYQNGYSAGLTDANVEFSPFRYVKQAAEGVGALMDVQIFPNVSLGALVMIPLAISVLATVIKIMRK